MSPAAIVQTSIAARDYPSNDGISKRYSKQARGGPGLKNEDG